MREPMIVFLCGPHCSGKSSILKSLYDESLLSDWGFEIGKELYYQNHFDTECQNQDFEFEVSRRELNRDHKYVKSKGIIGIETWHPGNLAYAAVRNPSIVSKLIRCMIKSPLISNARGIRLQISPEVILERTKTFQQNRDWAVDFYTKIDNVLDTCLKQLGLQDRCVFINANQSLEAVIEEVKKAIIDFKHL
ncbi:MAG: hypothetical protein HDR21_15120 [Lachnospiraceae bacterium]|nr:hypothetical protein [Lachnospiraceae bacterium]